MKFWEAVEVLKIVWEHASNSEFDHLTTKEKREVEAVLDLLEDIYKEVER